MSKCFIVHNIFKEVSNGTCVAERVKILFYFQNWVSWIIWWMEAPFKHLEKLNTYNWVIAEPALKLEPLALAEMSKN